MTKEKIIMFKILERLLIFVCLAYKEYTLDWF